MMGNFNDIGIDSELDWDRITHLFKMGIAVWFIGAVKSDMSTKATEIFCKSAGKSRFF